MISLPNTQAPEHPEYATKGELDVHSIFHTIQGEGPFSGCPATFVRLAGCNLQCPGCFGVSNKHRIPYLHMKKGPKKRLDYIQVGDEVLTFDSDFDLVTTQVKEVLHRTVSEWLEIRIDGKTYDVTPDHPFFTPRGLLNAEDLMIGDQILEARSNEIISYGKMGCRNPMKDPDVQRKRVENTDYVQMGKTLSNTLQKQIKEGTYIPAFSRMSPEQQERWRANLSMMRRREGNPNWKGNNPNLLDVQEAIEFRIITHCQQCGQGDKRLLIHHKDHNHENDDLNNLVVWCHTCHNQHHQRGYNFWNGNRSDGKQLIKSHNGQEVQKIQKCQGALPVINLSCRPHPTYLANRMWVHNCDTDYTSGRAVYQPSELLQTVVETRIKTTMDFNFGKTSRLIVITGGEPFRQNIRPFISAAVSCGWQVQIETNGTVWNECHIDIEKHCTIVCSPKTPKLDERMKDKIHALKYILKAGEVDKDGLPLHSLEMKCEVIKPWRGFQGEVYIQPMDEQDPVKNQANLQAAVQSCLRNGYRMCLQTHKIMGLE